MVVDAVRWAARGKLVGNEKITFQSVFRAMAPAAAKWRALSDFVEGRFFNSLLDSNGGHDTDPRHEFAKRGR